MIEGALLQYLLRACTPCRSDPENFPASPTPTLTSASAPAVPKIPPQMRERLMKIETKRALRTALQTAVGVAVSLPMIVQASGVPEALPWVAGSLAVAGGFARVMALPAVQRLLPSWLRTDDGAAGTLGYRGGHGDPL